MKVFATQLANGMSSDIVMNDGWVTILSMSNRITDIHARTVPMLVLASLLLLSITLAASVIPPFVARARSQYMYHVRNTAANRERYDDSDKEDSPSSVSIGDVTRDPHHHEDRTTERKRTNRLTMMIGKRATKIFGPGGMDIQRIGENELSNTAPVPYMQEPPRSAILEESDPRRKSVFKRLTLKTQSVVR